LIDHLTAAGWVSSPNSRSLFLKMNKKLCRQKQVR
jgi:hypothetical protein